MIIHIGLPKCGSTFLQNQVFNNIDKKVYSNELLSGMNIVERELFARGIYHKYGCKTKILLIIRDKDDWCRSLYNQYVKSFNTCLSFDRWFEKRFDKNLLDYDSYIKLLDGFFDDVFVYDYEDFIENKKKFVYRLCDDINAIRPVIKNIFYNKRLNDVEIMFFRCNKAFYDLYRIISGKREIYDESFNRVLPGMVLNK